MTSSAAHEATAWAHPNVALIKYWGKRDLTLNLPATGSISLTLGGLTTRTYLRLGDYDRDVVTLNGAEADAATQHKAERVLSTLRGLAHCDLKAVVESTNDFPTGAGLASSASGFAALTAAAAHALGLPLSLTELSAVARVGSGSAARSLFPGFVEMHLGTRPDGADAVASPLLDAKSWPLGVFVVVTSTRAKSVGSTTGMERTRATSPWWQSFVDGAPTDLAAMRQAIATRDLAAVGELAEHSCLKLHGLALSTRPALIYWNAATVNVMHAVYELRAKGHAAYFTIDAGPQVKVLCAPIDATAVRATLAAVPGVERVIDSCPGGPIAVRDGAP